MSTDGWLVDKVELKICDQTGYCGDYDVRVVGTGGGSFWIDGDCEYHNSADIFATGCQQGCPCFGGTFYLRRVSESWELNPVVGAECQKSKLKGTLTVAR